MPLVNGRFYLNPGYGRAVERARLNEQTGEEGENLDGRWVTINHRHVFIEDSGTPREQHRTDSTTRGLSARDQAYLDKYYDAVLPLAKKYGVDPALVSGVGIESSFGSAGTYLRTGDAFGMTGGSTKHMTTAASPVENVGQFFARYGDQIRGTGRDVSAFVYGLEGRDRKGNRVIGWKVYNTVNPNWGDFVRGGIGQMQHEIPIYEAEASGARVK